MLRCKGAFSLIFEIPIQCQFKGLIDIETNLKILILYEEPYFYHLSTLSGIAKGNRGYPGRLGLLGQMAEREVYACCSPCFSSSLACVMCRPVALSLLLELPLATTPRTHVLSTPAITIKYIQTFRLCCN